jgi:hypothetical protein
MRNLTSKDTVSIGNRSIANTVLFLVITFILLPNNTEAQNPKIALEQSANGPVDAPLSSPEWTKGHLSKNNSHYAPGSVIPYRAIVTNAPTNCPLKIRLNFLAIKSCQHAMDFPTNYNQSTEEHFRKFGDREGPVDPLAGLTANFSGPANIVFPLVPNYLIEGPPADQNTSRQNNEWFLAKYGTQSLSAWNAELSGIEFVGFSQHSTNCVTANGKIQTCNCIIEQSFDVSFTATSLPVVFAWGGHTAYDILTPDPSVPCNFNCPYYYGYRLNFTTESGSSGVGGLTKCLTQAQAAVIGGGNDAEFDGGGGEITYSFSSGGKPINPTTLNKNGSAEQEVAAAQKPAVFPNPNKGNTIVTLPSNLESVDIRLIDVSGKIIRNWSEYKNSKLELMGLKSGMYFLNIISRNSQNKTVLKVIVLN